MKRRKTLGIFWKAEEDFRMYIGTDRRKLAGKVTL